MKFMKRILIGIAMLLTSVVANAEPYASAQWWSYLAAYDAGPGSIRLDLKLRKIAPVKGFSHLVVTGVTYTSTQRNGLPEPGDVDRLNEISSAVVAAIAAKTPSIYAGTFTHDFEQLNYIYVPNGEGIAEVVKNVFSQRCPGCKTYTNLKDDASWSAYREFLFPSEVTIKHYGLQLD
jgi:hypothetical protein